MLKHAWGEKQQVAPNPAPIPRRCHTCGASAQPIRRRQSVCIVRVCWPANVDPNDESRRPWKTLRQRTSDARRITFWVADAGTRVVGTGRPLLSTSDKWATIGRLRVAPGWQESD